MLQIHHIITDFFKGIFLNGEVWTSEKKTLINRYIHMQISKN